MCVCVCLSSHLNYFLPVRKTHFFCSHLSITVWCLISDSLVCSSFFSGVQLLALLVPTLVSYLLDENAFSSADPASKGLHDFALQDLMRIGPLYPAAFKETQCINKLHIGFRLDWCGGDLVGSRREAWEAGASSSRLLGLKEAHAAPAAAAPQEVQLGHLGPGQGAAVGGWMGYYCLILLEIVPTIWGQPQADLLGTWRDLRFTVSYHIVGLRLNMRVCV